MAGSAIDGEADKAEADKEVEAEAKGELSDCSEGDDNTGRIAATGNVNDLGLFMSIHASAAPKIAVKAIDHAADVCVTCRNPPNKVFA